MFSLLFTPLITDRDIYAVIGLFTLANAFYVGAKNNTVFSVVIKNAEYSVTVPRFVTGTVTMILAKEYLYVGLACFLEAVFT